jgi:hypothetical protein
MYICPIFLNGNEKSEDISVGRNYLNRCDLCLDLHFESDEIFDIFSTAIRKDRYIGSHLLLDNLTYYIKHIILKLERQEKIKSLYTE